MGLRSEMMVIQETGVKCHINTPAQAGVSSARVESGKC